MERAHDYSVQELGQLFQSKTDLYRALKFGCQVLLPTKRMCPLEFLRAAVRGEKRLLRMDEVRLLNVPAFEELSAV